MSGWAYIGAALITALAVGGVGWFTTQTSRDVAYQTISGAARNAREDRIMAERLVAYVQLVGWVNDNLDELEAAESTLVEGHHKDEGTSLESIELAPLEKATTARIWTVGTDAIIEKVTTATRNIDEAIALLRRFRQSLPPSRYALVLSTLQSAIASLKATRKQIRDEVSGISVASESATYRGGVRPVNLSMSPEQDGPLRDAIVHILKPPTTSGKATGRTLRVDPRTGNFVDESTEEV